MLSYDLLVIGSGPAGQRAAVQATKTGARVALIEKRGVVGGACINTGTIPSKTMREAMMHLSGFLFQSVYGLNRLTANERSGAVHHPTAQPAT